MLENEIINIFLSVSMHCDSHKITGGVILTSEIRIEM